MVFVLELDNFQGPFDVLLELLKKQKLSITDVSLGQVTNDYLDYITTLELAIEEMNWFLYVAAKLTLDKSNSVLEVKSNDDEEVDITESLIQYATAKQQAKILQQLTKTPLHNRVASRAHPRPVASISLVELIYTYKSIIKYAKSLPKSKVIVSKQKQIEAVRQEFLRHIHKLQLFSTEEVISHSKSRHEAILYFITILDMLRAGDLLIKDQRFMSAEATV